jgi:aminoglycoside phosphotransferase (APT) family kinase protein
VVTIPAAPPPQRSFDRADIDAALAARLVAGQFPQWARLPVRPVQHSGWDNRTFHLGEAMTVRLPSAAEYASQVEKEQAWLPRLAPSLPLPIPTPLAMGEPAEGYPWRWSVYAWLDGKTAAEGGISDLSQFAAALGNFLVAFENLDASDGPAAGPHSFWRGGPLITYDAETRRAVAALDRKIDRAAAIDTWEAALEASWSGPSVWVHGDVAPGNLLLRDGRLGSVIDFGCCAVGDPACDLAIAWTLFESESRDAFHAALRHDDATWARGRGWALWKALITLANPKTAQSRRRESRQVIDRVLADYRSRDRSRVRS